MPTTYERYLNGNVSRIVYPEGSGIRRDYNSRGQLSATGSSTSNNSWSVQYATYHYLADGKLDYQDYANGVHTDFGYDPRGFLNHLTAARNGQLYADRTYMRDNRDRITAFQKGTGSTVNPMEDGHGDRFRYDEEGQLVEAWYNAADPANSGAGNNRYDGFTYDALGNRMGADPAHPLNFIASRGAMAFTRDDNGLNQYGSWGGSPVQHDDDIGNGWGSPQHANGVLMQDGNVTAGYNALNQPMYINTPTAGWVSFGYDPLGRCVKRWAGLAPEATTNPATYFYYDGWSLIQEGPSATAVDRVYLLGNRVDEIVADYSATTGQWLYHQFDARGHCILLTNGSGKLVEQYEYDAFGQPYFFNAAGTESSSSAYGNRFLFTGREWLSDLKLYDYRNRMYQPELGRFMQPDSKQFAAGDYNLYRYCHNDPVNRTDAFGFDAETDAQRAAFESGMTLLGAGIGSFFGGGTGALGFAGGPVGFVTTPAGAIEGAAIGGGIGLGIGKALSPILFKEPGNDASAPKPGEAGGDGAGKRFSESTRDAARAESNNTCVFCKEETTSAPGPKQSNTDHAIPKSRDGSNTLQNAQNTCRDCNLEKAAKTTEEYLEKKGR